MQDPLFPQPGAYAYVLMGVVRDPTSHKILLRLYKIGHTTDSVKSRIANLKTGGIRWRVWCIFPCRSVEDAKAIERTLLEQLPELPDWGTEVRERTWRATKIIHRQLREQHYALAIQYFIHLGQLMRDTIETARLRTMISERDSRIVMLEKELDRACTIIAEQSAQIRQLNDDRDSLIVYIRSLRKFVGDFFVELGDQCLSAAGDYFGRRDDQDCIEVAKQRREWFQEHLQQLASWHPDLESLDTTDPKKRM